MIMNLMKRWKTITPTDLDKLRVVEKQPPYVLLTESGQGAYATVHRARRKSSLIAGFQYAIKICELKQKPPNASTHSSDTEEEKTRKKDRLRAEESEKIMKVTVERCEAEIKIFRLLQKPNNLRIVHLFDSFQFGNQVWVVMEYMPIDLRRMLWLRYKMKLPKLLVWDAAIYIREIAKALKFMHSKRIVHKDLKPGNVMLSKSGKVKLCDFGISERIPEGQDKLVVERAKGTRQYMAPEMFQKGNEYDYAVDIWALGIILHNLCHHGKPLVGVMFYNNFFEAYQKSFYHYLARLVGSNARILSLEQTEIKEDRRIERTSRNLADFNRPYDSIRDFVHRALVPYPSTGSKDFPVTRKVTRKRMTLEEALQWANEKIQGRSELSCRNVVIRHVTDSEVHEQVLKDEIQVAKEAGTEQEQKVLQHYYGKTISHWSMLSRPVTDESYETFTTEDDDDYLGDTF